LRRRRFTMRLLGLMLALVVAGGIAASGQAHVGHGHHAKTEPGLELTYTKWIAPGFPNMTGVVGGDIDGRFGGAVLERTPDASGRFIHLTSVYIVVAPDPSESFTAHVEGVQDNQTATAVLDGRVTDGLL